MQARCLCGDVVWEAPEPLQFVHDCHCSRCRKIHGTPYVTMGAVTKAALRFVRGKDAVRSYASSPTLRRCFCGRCGSAVPGDDDWNGLVFVPIGALEGEFDAKSDGHIFAASKAPWFEITNGLPAFDVMPPGIEVEVLPDLGRGTGEDARAGGRIAGSCLCGAVRFACVGVPDLMRYCHCLRCRRARSAAHAANALVRPEKFHFTRGEEHVTLFKLPEADRFSQAFCTTCGSKLPWFIAARERWVVPLGALDDPPGGAPTEHIFVGSKAAWDAITDGLPQFAEYPDR